ncbi:YqgE/AlgH family protein [Aeromicrobium sp. CF4.19]|uniref:YqgE/AlgH family protein n=1 Tax=Aeromicrobium sp. CF4.19 TaxID=3373082 RepID=UPI003EE6D696
MESLRGRLLVATPAIASGPFLRSVVYLLDHDEDGALGVVVNHPLDAGVEDVLPDWGAHVNAPVCLFGGGPVAMDSALAVGVLATSRPPLDGWRPMGGRVGLVDLEGPLPGVGQLLGLRVFAGYAGWSSDQLEAEVAEGSWLVVQAEDADLISPQPEQLWREVLRRQDDDLRFWTTFPADPGAN